MFLDVAYVASAYNVVDRASRKVQRNSYTLPSWFVHWLHTKFTIAAHMFALAVQPLAPVFATLDDSLGSCGKTRGSKHGPTPWVKFSYSLH